MSAVATHQPELTSASPRYGGSICRLRLRRRRRVHIRSGGRVRIELGLGRDYRRCDRTDSGNCNFASR